MSLSSRAGALLELPSTCSALHRCYVAGGYLIQFQSAQPRTELHSDCSAMLLSSLLP